MGLIQMKHKSSRNAEREEALKNLEKAQEEALRAIGGDDLVNSFREFKEKTLEPLKEELDAIRTREIKILIHRPAGENQPMTLEVKAPSHAVVGAFVAAFHENKDFFDMVKKAVTDMEENHKECLDN